MDLDISNTSLPVYKALASPIRLQIIQLLSEKHMSVQDLASELDLSNSIVLMHLNKLAEAQLITFKRQGHQKVSSLKVDNINVHFPNRIYPSFESYTIKVPVGHYTTYSVEPSCGLAGMKDFIGKVDIPAYFMDPNRINAHMIWWTKGFVEYHFPNYLKKSDNLEMLDISAELGSEFPFSNNVWPSDITIFVNNIEVGTWTSPGDFSDTRGKFTPKWVPDNVNQYGILKTFRITDHGSYLDGQPFSEVSLTDIDNGSDIISVRFAIKEEAVNQGGCTIFGSHFGNYDQDIEMKLFYS
ncbi:metalloregulator ArsR/SmtB family transcription factor [Lentilactobacillus senioris]|uniref:ArsR/SmtB family transcription factor n=1 Tax=Lentilactobacillus senioris TaxID=931534 RepID=UPI002281A5EE|nr:metalloregulator ArsR/SmtB family transcription factor [Lentilactobacillus senioris]MCY9805950.1 metalloregulator ArsR/SmtB family transcription factor [Lentilactobacillus senioris]